jgi:hypothetical protein
VFPQLLKRVRWQLPAFLNSPGLSAQPLSNVLAAKHVAPLRAERPAGICWNLFRRGPNFKVTP